MPINYFAIYWGIAFTICFFLYFKHLFKIFHWTFALAVSYTISQTILFGWYTQYWEPYSQKLNMALKIHGMETLIVFFLALFILEKVTFKPIWFSYIFVVNITATLLFIPFRCLFKTTWLMGLTVNPSMNACVTAITMPFVFLLPLRWQIPLFVTGLILVLISHSTTPVFCVLAAFFFPVLLGSRRKWIPGVILFALVLALCFLVPNFIHVFDRGDNYLFFWKEWRGRFNPLIGCGNGGFYIWGPLLTDLKTRFTDAFFRNLYSHLGVGVGDRVIDAWAWLHSDIYQTLFELGVIGLILWALAVGSILKRLMKNMIYLGGAVAWLTCALFYYPVHFPLHLFLGLSLSSIAIKNQK